MGSHETQRHADAGFTEAMHAVLERVREATSADIVALYPYDEETDSFYAPLSLGSTDGDVASSLPDLADQIRRFRTDQAAGKTPDDLSPLDYGANAWLVAMRRFLVSADAQREINSSFVRRHHIRAVVGLPLIVGSRLVALLYLNFADSSTVDVGGKAFTRRVEAVAADAADAVEAARDAAERAISATVARLVRDLTSAQVDSVDPASMTRQFETALDQVIKAAHLGAGALYIAEPGGSRFLRVASVGSDALAESPKVVYAATSGDLVSSAEVREALARDQLFPVDTWEADSQGAHPVLLLADQDHLALERRTPAVHALLQTASDLLGAMVVQRQLAEALDESNRTLGAVTRLGTRLLAPGSSQQQVLETAVRALTDDSLPELDFEFAAFFLLDARPDGSLEVVHNAGATVSAAIDSVGIAGESYRVPAWIVPGTRSLGPNDIVSYVATRRRAVVVEAREAEEPYFVVGYPEQGVERLQVPVVGRDGSVVDRVRAVRLREQADRSPLQALETPSVDYRSTDEFTLDADLFHRHRHGQLVRVFMPFGQIHADGGTVRAAGVLEVGYHVQRRRRLERVQIEALRACAATLAVSVETARLYEDVTRRAQQLEIVNEVSRTIATSIDLDQTLHLVAANMVRSINASLCLIALLEEDGSAWYGAAASDMEDVWRQRRVEHPERSIVFEVTERGAPIAVEHALDHELVSPYMARMLGIRSLLALPLQAGDTSIGAVILAEQNRERIFTEEEINTASGLAAQAAMAIRNARLHFHEEEEQHIQKDVILAGFGQWGQKAYQHLQLLKTFFNFRVHVVEADRPGRREVLEAAAEAVLANGDAFYWDSPDTPAHDILSRELEPSCYVITYIATPAETHLPLLKLYYDLSNVVLIEKPLGAPPEEYRQFLDHTDGAVEIVAADHYFFKMEVRLLALLLTEERNLRAFLDEIEEVEIDILEQQPPGGSGAQIGMIADLIPHAFAILSLLTPLDRVEMDPERPLDVGRYQPLRSEHETYARFRGTFAHQGRQVRVTIDVGKGVVDSKSIKLIGPRRMGGRRSFYKFDFSRGEAMDGTQSALRAAVRPIRQPGVRDNAHLSMLRHVIEKKHPSIGILNIREALRMNARIQHLEQLAAELLESGRWVAYEQGQRPAFGENAPVAVRTVGREPGTTHTLPGERQEALSG